MQGTQVERKKLENSGVSEGMKDAREGKHSASAESAAKVKPESEWAGPQKRALASPFSGPEFSASSTQILSLLEEKNVPVLNESSLSILGSLKTGAVDDIISKDEVKRQIDAVKELVSQIKASYTVLINQESNLKRARQLLHKGQLSLTEKEDELRKAIQLITQKGQGDVSGLDTVLTGYSRQKLEKERAEYLRQKETLEKQKELLRNEEEALKKQSSMLNEKRSDLNDTKNRDSSALKEREQHTREELEKLKEQVEQYKRLVEEVKQQIVEDRLDSKNPDEKGEESAKSETDRSAKEIAAKNAEIERMAKEIVQYQDQIGQILDQINREQQLMQQVHELQNKLKKEKQQLNQLQQQLTKDQSKLKEARRKNEKSRNNLERDRAQLEKDRYSVKKKEEDIKAERSKLRKKEEVISSDKKNVDRERSQLKRELKNFDKEKDKIKEEQSKLDQERKKLRQEKERLKKDVQKAQNAKERIEKERAKADQDCTNAQKRKGKILGEIQKAVSEEKSKRAELMEIEKNKAQLKAELESLRKQKRKMEKRRSKSPVAPPTLKQSSSDEASEMGLKKKLSELEIENKRLKKQMELAAAASSTAAAAAAASSSFGRSGSQHDLKSGFASSSQAAAADTWGSNKIISGGQASNDNKSSFSFSQNSWLRSMKGSIGIKNTMSIPSFTNLPRSTGAWGARPAGVAGDQRPIGQRPGAQRPGAGGRPGGLSHAKEPQHLSHGLPTFQLAGGPPGFPSASSSQPMGGLMFAQRGKKVVARYGGDKQWYDAEILDVVLNGAKGPKYIVKFKGYSGKEEVSAADIRPKDDYQPQGADVMQTNGHAPGPPSSGHNPRSSLRSQPQWSPLVKPDRPGPGVWGGGGGGMKSSMTLNGLNGPTLGMKTAKMGVGRNQYMDSGFYGAPHMMGENGKQVGPNGPDNGVLRKSMLLERERS